MSALAEEITFRISTASSTDSLPSNLPDDRHTPLRSQPSQADLPIDSDLKSLPTLSRGPVHDNIGQLLYNAEIKLNGEENGFWTMPLVESIVTRAQILEELKNYQSQTEHHNKFRGKDLPSLADKICTQYRKVFALLCVYDNGHCIQDFIAEDVNDDDLPLIPFLDGSHWTNYAYAKKKDTSTQLFCLTSWARHDLRSFGTVQRRFLPVFFRLDNDPASQRRIIKHQDLEPTSILPIHVGESMGQGGFGEVRQVWIHPHCHNFRDILHPILMNNCFAQKRLTKRTNGKTEEVLEFWREVENLKRFSGFSHPHLVTLLATWTIKKDYYLLFPLAECTLDDFLDRQPVPQDRDTGRLDVSMLQWISKQLLGIIGGLHRIHNPRSGLLSIDDQKYGRHGDLKPENVLWYRSSEDTRGVLVIADLGLSATNSILSRSRMSNGKVQGTPRYKPPESEIKGPKISRSYDIWTLGCLVLEVVCWALDGPGGRTKFLSSIVSTHVRGTDTDLFFDVKRDNHRNFLFMVKRQVQQKIKDLHSHESCSQLLHDLLFLVEEEMLVVISAEKGRIKVENLLALMTDINARALVNAHSYCDEPCGPSRPAESYAPVKAELKAEILSTLQPRNIPVYDGRSQQAATVKQLEDRT